MGWLISVTYGAARCVTRRLRGYLDYQGVRSGVRSGRPRKSHHGIQLCPQILKQPSFQCERFIGAARQVGADDDEAAFKAKLTQIARQKPKMSVPEVKPDE